MPIEQEALKKEKKMTVDFREISLTGSQIYHGKGIPDYNPDTLVGRRGLEIYSKMREDDQVKAVLTMKKFARLATPWEIQPASQSPEDIEIADFVEANFNNIAGTFEDCILNMLTALDYGFSITEKIWYRIEKGDYAGKIGLKCLKTREPIYYGFESDEFGNLRPDGIVYQGPTPIQSQFVRVQNTLPSITEVGEQFGSRLPIEKFVIYSYNKEFSNWYGRSDLRAAYRSWWSKEILIRFMNIYMERFGMPTHVAKYPKNMGKNDRETLKTILDRVQTKYSIVIPDDVALELLNAGTGGGEAFRSAVEMHNRFISRSILVPDLMGYNEISGGAYALGKKHFDVFLWMLQKLGRDIEESLVGEQIIKQLVDYNYSNVQNYPTFKFESITAEGTATRASIIQMGVAGGFINPQEDWIREYLALPSKDENISLGLPARNILGEVAGLPESLKVGTEEGLKDTEDANVDKILSDIGVSQDEVPQKLTKEYVEACKKWKTKKFKKINGLDTDERFDYKIDFTKMKDDLDEYESESVLSLSDIVKMQKDALLKAVERKQIVENKDYNSIDTLQLKYVGDFKKNLEQRLVKLYLDSKLETVNEISKGSDGNVEITTKFADVTIQPWMPVSPTEAIDFFNRKVICKVVAANGVKKLIQLATRKELDYYDSKAFAIAGIERDNILKQAKLILLNGIKNGDPGGTQFALGNMFDSYLDTGEIKDDELATPYRLETIVRTNFSEALNMGRRSMIEDPDLADFVPYQQYKAIMDDRVRPSHAEMHNRIYKADDPIWDTIYPPNGFSCRCLVVPITKYEVQRLNKEGDGVELASQKLPPNFPDQGFAKYASTTKSIVITLNLGDEQKVEQMQEQVSGPSELTEIKKRLLELESKLNKGPNTDEVTKLKNEKKLLIDKIRELVSQSPKVGTDSELLRKQNQELLSKVSFLNNVLSKDQKEQVLTLTELQNKLNKLETVIKDKQSGSDINELNKESELVSNRLNILNTEVDSNQKILNVNPEEIKKLNEENIRLTSLIDGLKSDNESILTQLNTTKENKEVKVSELINTQSELLKQIEDLKKSIVLKNRAEIMLDVLNKQIGDLNLKNSLLQDKISGLILGKDKELENMKLEKDLLQNRIDQLSKELISSMPKPMNEETKEIIRCPYPNCGSNRISVKKDNGVYIINCKECLNQSKLLNDGQVFFWDKGTEQWVKNFSIITTKVVDVIRCPYPNCGSLDLILVDDNKRIGLKEYYCKQCRNTFKILDTGDLYLFDKFKNQWVKEDMRPRPIYITGER